MKKTMNYNESLRPVELSRFMLINFRFLQLLGLCPISLRLKGHSHSSPASLNLLSSPRNKAKCLLAWEHVHILVFSALHLSTFINYHATLLFNGDNFGKFNDAFKLSTYIVAHFITLIESILRRREMHDFLEIYSKLHASWATFTTKQEAFIYRRYIFHFCIFVVVMLVVDVTYLIEIRHRAQWLIFFVSFTPSVMICRFRVVQFILYLELLRIEVNVLNSRIRRLVALSRQQHNAKSETNEHLEKEICQEIKKLMDNYDEIYRMTDLMKKSTAWSMVANYIKAYIKMLSDCYWGVWVAFNGDDIVAEFEYSLILPTAVNIFQLLLTARNCINTTQLVAHNVHKLRHAVEHSRVSTRIQNLSLQIMHQRINLDAFGFFFINCHLGRSILGSITTYMIFFIQFMPKFKNI